MSRVEVIINKIVIIVLSFFMFFSGSGLIVAGVRARKKQWTICGLVYIGAGWIFMSIGLVALYLILYVASIIHTIVISKEYCLRLKVIRESKDIILQKKQEMAEKQQADIFEEIVGEKKAEKQDTAQDVEVKKTDINQAEEAELSAIPGISLILAKRIIDVRREQPFLSLEDFYRRLSIDKDKEKLMEKYLVCTKVQVVDSTVRIESKDIDSHTSGRKIDI